MQRLVGLPKEIVVIATTANPPISSAGRTRAAHAIATFAITLLATLATAALAAGQAHADTACDLYTTSNGTDSAPGTLAQPFATVQRLAGALHAGQTGCVRGGAYTEDVTVTHAGSAGAPITITSYPGERATLVGRLWIHPGADYVTVANMNLNGRNTGELPSPDVNAAHTTFTGNDVTDEHTAICFDLGSDTTYGRATDTVIQGNRIHQCGKLPAANHDHGIYVESSTGARIVENVIYDNADRGIQLYPDAQQTTIEHNIIDANGEGIIFSGDFGAASSDNTVANNLVTNATLRYDIESWYPEGNPIGQNNAVQHNCLWGGAKGAIQTLQTGFTATDDTTANPEYANPTNGDYRVNSTSPCAALLTSTAVPTQPFTTTSTITYTGPAREPAGGGTSGSGAETTTSSTPSETSSTTTTTTTKTTTTGKHRRHAGKTAVAATARLRVSAHRRTHHHRARRASARKRFSRH